MGREIRKVPLNWEHPKKANGSYQPMREEYYGDAVEEWISDHNFWLQGLHKDQLKYPDDTKKYKFYAEWNGSTPDVDYYNKEKWTDEEACCFQIYETVSEGTPVSPVFMSLEAMEAWLIREGHSENAAKNFCKSGYAPSMTFNSYTGEIKTGIETCE